MASSATADLETLLLWSRVQDNSAAMHGPQVYGSLFVSKRKQTLRLRSMLYFVEDRNDLIERWAISAESVYNTSVLA